MREPLLILALLSLLAPATVEREEEVTAIALALLYHAPRHDRSPWRMAALAMKETGLRPHLVGKLGECGAWQVLGRHLRPPVKCSVLQTPDGGLVGALRALDQWEAWADARELPEGAEWDCYASGESCRHKVTTRPWPATRRLLRHEATLRAAASGIVASQALCTDIIGVCREAI